MRIVDVREAALPVASTMRNAVFSFADMTTSVVAVVTDVVRGARPIVGYAFNSTGRHACGGTMRGRFIPRLLGADPEALVDAHGAIDPERALDAMLAGEKPGGDAERSIAVGTIETAIWDAVAKIADVPLWKLLADRYHAGRAPQRVFCYVGGGWYRPGGTLDDLRDEIRRHLDAGYTLVKIKVGGMALADDCARIEAALDILGDGQRLAVDANAKFARADAFAYADALARYGLRWFEEPCHPHDFALLAEIAARYAPTLATGENLFSLQDVANLVRFGGLRPERDLVQVDPPQAYGLAHYAKLVAMLESHGFARTSVFPHGGNQMSLAVVAGLGLGGCEAYPGVFGMFGGYADDARVDGGHLPLPQRPGIGFEGQSALYAAMRRLGEG